MGQVLCPSVVGRQAEQAQLDDLLVGPTVAGRAVVVVSGEADIGKSRLARETAERARMKGLRVLQGRAVPADAPIAYRAFTEALQAGLAAGDLDALVSGSDRALLRAVLPRTAPDAVAVQASPLPVFDAIQRLLLSVADARGLLVVVEDLHWADAETLSLVEYLADHLSGGRVLCVCTVRTDAGGRAEAVLYELLARRACTPIALTRLVAGEVEEMTRRCLGVDKVPLALLETLQTRASGVPFLIEEMLSAYLDAGGPAERAPEWWISRRIAGALPVSYRALVAERLDRLPEARGRW